MNSLTDLCQAFKDYEPVIRLRKLEAIIKKDEALKEKVKLLHTYSKQAINARELGLDNAYNDYYKKYQAVLKDFDNNVILTMYLEAKAEIEELINLVKSVIEEELNKALNN